MRRVGRYTRLVADDPQTGIIPMEPALKLLSVELSVIDGVDRGAVQRVAQGRARIGTA